MVNEVNAAGLSVTNFKSVIENNNFPNVQQFTQNVQYFNVFRAVVPGRLNYLINNVLFCLR